MGRITPIPICLVENCGRVAKTKGYCDMHYQRLKKHGSPGQAGPLHRTDYPDVCTVPGCKRPSNVKGICDMHYIRLLRKGGVGEAETQRMRGRICAVPGCGKPTEANSICNMHYIRLRKTGDVGPAKPIFDGNGYITKHGYRRMIRKGHPNANKSGAIFEHVVVMTEMLGRPLTKGETVHHKNGVKADNRPANLELWCHSHHSGQRVTDRIADAIYLLGKYATDKSLWPEGTDQLQRSFRRVNVQPIHETPSIKAGMENRTD